MVSNFKYRWEWFADNIPNLNIKPTTSNSSKSKINLSLETWKPFNEKIQTLLNESITNKQPLVIIFYFYIILFNNSLP
jgi:hypothetical protein